MPSQSPSAEAVRSRAYPEVERNDLVTYADRIARTIRAGGGFGHNAVASILEEAQLGPDDLARMLELLRERGVLNDFLGYARRPRFWAALRSAGLDWQFVLDHYELTAKDTGDFFFGMLFGAGVSGTLAALPFDLLQGLYVLTGSLWNEDLARRRDEFIAGLRRILGDPQGALKGMAQQWWDEFDGYLARLDYFSAGRMLGGVLMDVVLAVRSAPRAVARATSLFKSLPKLTPAMAASMLPKAETLRAMADQIRKGARRWVSPDTGHVLEHTDDGYVILDQRGNPLAAATDDEIAQVIEKAVDELAAAAPGPRIRVQIDYDALSQQVAQEVPRGNMSATDWGKAVHKRAAEILRADPRLTGITVAVDEPLRKALRMSPEFANMTVGEFYTRFRDRGLPEGLPKSRDLLNPRLGDLKPDLIIHDPANGFCEVKDLTARWSGRSRHVSKTLLYAHVIHQGAESGGISGVKPGFFEIGDYYYDPSKVQGTK